MVGSGGGRGGRGGGGGVVGTRRAGRRIDWQVVIV